MRHAISLLLLFVAAATAQKTLKFLLFTGPGASIEDIALTEQCFTWANNNNFIPGYRLQGTRNSRVSTQSLQGFDVLVMPGGQNFYPPSSQIDVTAGKAFVQAGGGYYGTCAGAYAGCTQIYPSVEGVVNPYTGEKNLSMPLQTGWSISKANCHIFYYVGTANIYMTPPGSRVLNYTGVVPIDHHNGPAMDGGTTPLGVFNDTPSKGKNAIVADTYGQGNVILVAPHPEHTRLNKCPIVARAAAFAGKAISAQAVLNDLLV